MIQQVQHLKLNKRGNAAEDRSDINTTGNESKSFGIEWSCTKDCWIICTVLSFNTLSITTIFSFNYKIMIQHHQQLIQTKSNQGG